MLYCFSVANLDFSEGKNINLFSFFIFFMYEKARNELGTTVHLPVELGEILLTIPS